MRKVDKDLLLLSHDLQAHGALFFGTPCGFRGERSRQEQKASICVLGSLCLFNIIEMRS